MHCEKHEESENRGFSANFKKGISDALSLSIFEKKFHRVTIRVLDDFNTFYGGFARDRKAIKNDFAKSILALRKKKA